MRRRLAAARPVLDVSMGVGHVVIAVQVLLVVLGLPGLSGVVGLVVTGGGVVLVMVCSLLVAVAPVADDVDPVALASPLRGRWAAVNSPGQRLPSHGTRARGQYSAVDVCGPADDGTPPVVGWALRGSRPEEYAFFGAPVHAMAGGRVVTAHDGRRDHRSRNTWPLLAFMLVVEGLAREVAGTRAILGNHVVVDHGDGTFAAYAHLRRATVAVRVGDEVATGDVLGRLGNTGNTSMPHLHVQLMDRADPDAAAGLPMTWHDVRLTGDLDPALARWGKDRDASPWPACPATRSSSRPDPDRRVGTSAQPGDVESARLRSCRTSSRHVCAAVRRRVGTSAQLSAEVVRRSVGARR